MSKLHEIAQELRGFAKSSKDIDRAKACVEDFLDLADEIEDAEAELREQLREVYLAKALKGNDMRTGNPSATEGGE